MPLARACIDCGQLTTGTRCPTCKSDRNRLTHGNTYYRSAEWKRLSAAAAELHGRICALCDSTRHVAAHHVIHRTDGGPDTLDNLIMLCASCHHKAHRDPATDQLVKAIARA